MTDPGAGAGQSGDEIAGLAQRALARSIDLMVVGIISLALFAPQLIRNPDDADAPRWVQFAVFGLWLAYEAGTTTFLGQTMGKLATGCRVADRRTGRRPNLARSIVRAAVMPALLALFAFFGLLGYATPALDQRERRGLLDRVSGTVVVKAVPGERR
ncbi:MAG: RDD family protein [Actinomycetota bacterium]